MTEISPKPTKMIERPPKPIKLLKQPQNLKINETLVKHKKLVTFPQNLQND